jgi:hypothetical protein
VANAFIFPFHTQTMHINSFYTQQRCYVSLKTLAGFEPGSSRSWGGCDVHCATRPGQIDLTYLLALAYAYYAWAHMYVHMYVHMWACGRLSICFGEMSARKLPLPVRVRAHNHWVMRESRATKSQVKFLSHVQRSSAQRQGCQMV